MRLHPRAAVGVLAATCALVAVPGPASAATPPAWTTGINLTDWSPSGYADAKPALQAAAADGIRSVTLVPTLYVDDATDSSVAPEPDRTPTDASLRQAAADARALGMTVTLKPHVDMLDGTFRGELAPADPAAWFVSYDAWVAHYAALAQSIHADTFVVGTELDSLVAYEPQFARVIAIARSGFRGRLTYAANWNVVGDVPFWADLDAIGVDAYVPLGDASSSMADLQAAWAPFEQELAGLHDQTGKPVLFTELGYQSRTGALAAPFSADGPPDQAVQARAYAAAYRFWSSVPWLQGISWWDWSAQPMSVTAADVDFSPRGKAAEAVLRSWTGAPPAPVAAPAGDGAGLRVGLAVLLVVVGAAGVATALVRQRRRVRASDPASGGPTVTIVPVPVPLPVASPVVDRELHHLLDTARRTLDSRTIVLFLRDETDPRVARAVAQIGVGASLVGRVFSSDEGLMGHVLATGNPIAVADYNELLAPISHAADAETRAALSVPVRAGETVIGALTVGRVEQYAPSERHLLRPLAAEIGRLVAPLPGSVLVPAP